MINISSKTLIPAVIKYITSLANSVNAVKAAGGCDCSVQSDLLKESSDLLAQTKAALAKLEKVTDAGLVMAEGKGAAEYYKDVVKAAMTELRAPIDKLEIITLDRVLADAVLRRSAVRGVGESVLGQKGII